MRTLYPLKFTPIPREMIWGGNKLQHNYNKGFPPEARIGESWEISGYPGKLSVAANGFLQGNTIEELIEVYMGDLVGEKVFDRYGIEFPLLIKLIDANDNLSIQVHPDDELAQNRHNGRGKTEMWYVLDAEPGAELISGFNTEVSRGLFLDKLNVGKLPEMLNFEKVAPGDVFFMPAGRIHAIGKGIVLAEIQQCSDITYRVYDWNRVDAEGKPRELHVDLALDAIDYTWHNDYKTVVPDREDVPVLLADCQWFTTQRLLFKRRLPRDYSLADSFVIHICTKGGYNIYYNGVKDRVAVSRGETVLIPAVFDEVVLETSGITEILEVYIKN